MTPPKTILVRISPGTAPDEAIEELMDALRDLAATMGYDPDVLVFKIVRPIPPTRWQRVRAWLRSR